jgi:hypothetical protein
MTYFVVRDGAIQEAFETLEEATERAGAEPVGRVIGDEWVTLTSAKDRVRQAFTAIDEIAPLLDAEEVDALKARLQPLQDMIDSALGRLGLRG